MELPRNLAFSCSLCFALLLTLAGVGNCCFRNQCRIDGPPIRFPFRLKYQSERCGYPGFELYCSEDNVTMMNLILNGSSPAANFVVQGIDYEKQYVNLSDTGNCTVKYAQSISTKLPSPFSLIQDSQIGIPFILKSSPFAMFKCPSDKTITNAYTNPSLGVDNDGSVVYLVDANIGMEDFPSAGCVKMHTVTIPQSLLVDGILPLTWSYPSCQRCESSRMECGYSEDGGNKVQCLGGHPRKGRLSALVAGTIIGSLLLLALLLALYRAYRVDRLHRESQRRIEKFLDDYNALNPARYTYADLRRITGDLKEEVGKGAYGTVYKGKLSNEIFVAVKMLNNAVGEGEEFINEVKTMGSIHHVNVVRLVGYCADGFRRALVYDFLPNESLEKFISSGDGRQQHFDWKKLQDIALGIAKGMEYLHQGCDQRILHFDIKPQNILLDENYNPKISDFGLAKLCAKDQSAVSMTAARGTMGYIAPEVFSRNFGKVTHKSDVYSFGMVVLEMVGGKRSGGEGGGDGRQAFFPRWVYSRLEEGKEICVGAEDGEEDDERIARRLSVVGLCCIQWHPDDRPSMGDVVHLLEGSGELQMPPNPFLSPEENGHILRRQPTPPLEAIAEDGAEAESLRMPASPN